VLGLVMEGDATLSATTGVYQQALAYYTAVGLRHKAAEPLAALARLTLQQGDCTAAHKHAEVLLQTLDKQPLVGYDEPFRVYLSSYHVLAAHGDPRATLLLKKGYALLQLYAERLPSGARSSFLEAVPVHRELLAAYTAHVTGD